VRAVITGTVILTAAATAVVAPTATGRASAPADPGPPPYGRVLSILPPGQSGTITALDLLQVIAGDPLGRVAVDGRNAPENFADQLEMYDALNTVDPGSLAGADLDAYYKDASAFEPAHVTREERPRAGVRVRWDSLGVPYINGTTYENTLWGAGYAATLDRMFLMDVLRHAGQARLAEFAGGTEANLAMDTEQLRTAYYTRREAAAQLTRLAAQNGAEGRRLLRGADAYLDGINAAQDAMCPGGIVVIAPTCPAEYVALQKLPEPWTRADLTYVASLVGGIFGKGGGAEYANAVYYQRLAHRFGERRAATLYRQLRSKNDAEAPTTATTRTPYGTGRLRPHRPGVALPDVDGPIAGGTGAETTDNGLGLPDLGDLLDPADDASAVVDGPFGPIRLGLPQQGMSNALLVSGEHTTTGHPITVFGPQTSYYTPQLLTEQVLVGPGVKARGVAFAGTNLVVQLGHGVDYAWSATSASNDNVDTVVERLCDRDGSQPTVRSRSYLRGGRCVPMFHRTHTETVLPNVTAPVPPKTYSFDVWRTHHGIVQLRTTVRGRPVAIVTQRTTYGREVSSILGFSRFNDPRVVHDAASFQRAAGGIDYTFNWFYADDRDIAYFSSGRLPRRAEGVDFDLPRWGSPRYDWQGWLPWDRHPRQVNPDRGYLVSWNNKPAPGWAAPDDTWGWGTVHRSLALSDRIDRVLRRGGEVSAASLVGLVQDAATVDVRARYTLPWLLKAIGDDPRTADARRLLRAWLADGAHRVDRDRDGAYAHQAAIALFDTWWQDGPESVAYELVADRLGPPLTRRLPQALDNHPRGGTGSAWNSVAWYGYVAKDLRQVLGRPVGSPYSVGLCGEGRLPACRETLRGSLRAAVDRAVAAQGVDRVRELTYDKTTDAIRSSTAGTVGVRPVDWQNRPTFQQVVSYLRHRPR
jgi:acyl-homoserine lactone acylase PvdQ